MKSKATKRLRVRGQWFTRARRALLRRGMTVQELDVIRRRDMDGLTLAAIGEIYSVQRERIRQIYLIARRKLRHPRNADLVPARVRGGRSVSSSVKKSSKNRT